MNRMAGLAMAVLLGCAACTAKEAKENERKDDSIEQDFKRLDANHDGSISKDEAAKDGSPVLQANFDRFDANKDGKLSLQEITAFVMAQRAETARQRDEAFRRIDANHDGGISKEEAEKESDPFLITNFAAIDSNKDGKLSLQELNAYADAQAAKTAGHAAKNPQSEQLAVMFIDMDKDRNGALSREELKARPELHRDFDKMDTDHDGMITPLEFSVYMRAQSGTAQVQGQAETGK